MKITMSRKELVKVLEMEDVANDIGKALGKPVQERTFKDSVNIIYDLYDMFKESNKLQKVVRFNINFKSKENFLWIEINEQFIIEYMEIYYGFIKELIEPSIAIFKATKKLIEKNKILYSKYNNF